MSSATLSAVLRHAQSSYPDECCGLLIGTVDSKQWHCTSNWPATNAWSPDLDLPDLGLRSEANKHSQRDRYWIDPAELLQAQRKARQQQQAIIGVYHSHPDHVAVPSATDRHYAWPDYSYLIIAVRNSRVVDYDAWILDRDQQFTCQRLIRSDRSSTH